MSSKLSIGNEIKDLYKETHKWVQNNVKWLKDIEQFYRERAKLEREYSDKLSGLTKEFLNRKSKISVSLTVGDTPSTTPGSLEAASVVAWNEVLSQTEMICKDRGQLADEFERRIAEQLAGLYAKVDMTLTKISGFNEEIMNKRGNMEQELEKSKKRYDEVCASMEMARNKNTKSSNERTQRKMEQKESEMNIVKNDYLIKINQSNRVKDKYYFQDVPEVVDSLQDLNESRIAFLNDIWRSAKDFEVEAGQRVQERLKTADTVVSQNLPSLSTAIFIKHNLKQWKEPNDFRFEPSPVWHDDDKFVVSTETELNDLKIKLAKAEKAYSELQDLTQSEISKLSALNQRKKEIKANENEIDSQAFYETLKSYLSVVTPFTSHETLKLQAEVQIESIQNNVPEKFDLSTDDIDLSKLKKKSGLFNKLKHNLLPEPSSKPNHRFGLFGNNSEKRNSATQSFDTDAASISSTTSLSTNQTTSNKNKVLYAYSKQDSDEISINVGDSISLEAPDTGSGWTKIRNETTGEIGLVPTTYIVIKETANDRKGKEVPKVPPPRRTTLPTRTMEAQYAYVAQGDDELSINVSDVIKVIKVDDGSGWTYGELNGKKGLFPTSYCK
ncbi:hypothetical protein HG537_0C03230 [Torulaspora globosa]|uniref:Protein BZZ1 n=1 Tax=Torulaspora globosa TaxID=48254 RepID=A0A7H9HTE6_9SACH|nr:hypothetical protein HG537_0C03230 [Torulaspora sp. CBS 2947]